MKQNPAPSLIVGAVFPILLFIPTSLAISEPRRTNHSSSTTVPTNPENHNSTIKFPSSQNQDFSASPGLSNKTQALPVKLHASPIYKLQVSDQPYNATRRNFPAPVGVNNPYNYKHAGPAGFLRPLLNTLFRMSNRATSFRAHRPYRRPTTPMIRRQFRMPPYSQHSHGHGRPLHNGPPRSGPNYYYGQPTGGSPFRFPMRMRIPNPMPRIRQAMAMFVRPFTMKPPTSSSDMLRHGHDHHHDHDHDHDHGHSHDDKKEEKKGKKKGKGPKTESHGVKGSPPYRYHDHGPFGPPPPGPMTQMMHTMNMTKHFVEMHEPLVKGVVQIMSFGTNMLEFFSQA